MIEELAKAHRLEIQTDIRLREQNVLVGTHGTALSTILHAYDQTFEVKGFYHLYSSLSYVVRVAFDWQAYVGREELHWNQSGYHI